MLARLQEPYISVTYRISLKVKDVVERDSSRMKYVNERVLFNLCRWSDPCYREVQGNNRGIGHNCKYSHSPNVKLRLGVFHVWCMGGS